MTGPPRALALGIALGLLCLAPCAQAESARFEAALRNGRRARAALVAANDFLLEWVARKDGNTALFGNGPDRNLWTVHGTAARVYPHMVLAAYLTNTAFYNGLLRETLRDEARLTARLLRLPDDYDLAAGRFVHPDADPERIAAGASIYAAEGLARVTAVAGPGPWSERMRAIVDDLFRAATIRTAYSSGPLPSGYAAVNGNLLRVLPWLAAHTGDERYLAYARRIGDAYCLGILPKNGGLPAHSWNFEADRADSPALLLNGTGAAILEGLAHLYETEAGRGTDRADIYRPTLAYMFDILLTHARTPEGLFYARIEPDGRGGYAVERKNLATAWVRILAAARSFGLASGNPAYTLPARDLLGSLPDLADRAWRNRPDLAAAGIPGVLSLLSPARAAEPLEPARVWAEGEVDGLLAGGDPANRNGQLARVHAALAYALYKTQGIRADPWRADLACGAVAVGDTLYIGLDADSPWQGRLLFAAAPPAAYRASFPFGMALPAPFAVSPDATYHIRISGAGASATWAGALLRDGLQLALRPGKPHRIRIVRLPTGPPSPEPADTLNTEPPAAR